MFNKYLLTKRMNTSTFYFYASVIILKHCMIMKLHYITSEITSSSFTLLEIILLDLCDNFIGKVILQGIKMKAFFPVIYPNIL